MTLLLTCLCLSLAGLIVWNLMLAPRGGVVTRHSDYEETAKHVRKD